MCVHMQASTGTPQQMPNLWGSKQAVRTSNVMTMDLADFVFAPHTSPNPPGWDNKVVILFVMRGMAPNTTATMLVTRPQ